MSYFDKEDIFISKLSLWDENARFPNKYFSKSEKDLIKYFCNNRNFKIELLAKEIVKDFDLTQLEKIVVYKSNERNIVLEGNRRLAVYKLLMNPGLAPNDALKHIFLILKQEVSINSDFSFECIVTDNKTEGFRYIERKHLYGNNEVSWGEQERTNYNIRRGKANPKEMFKSNISKIIKELDIPEKLKEQVLGPGYVTNFWRILDNSVAWRQFGMKFNDNGDLDIRDVDFEKKLKVIILNVLQKQDFSGEKIDSRSLNTNEQKKKYLDSITNEDFIKVDIEIEKNVETDLFGEQSVALSSSKTAINPKSSLRKYLIPKTCRLNIKETKINNIYRELRDNLLLDDTNNAVPNAVGVLFRVYLEISLDYYAKMNGHDFERGTKISKKIPWVVNSLKDKGYNSRFFNNINKVGSTQKEKSYLSIDNFHEYVHSLITQPTSSELKGKWDNIEKFFEILWDSLQTKK